MPTKLSSILLLLANLFVLAGISPALAQQRPLTTADFPKVTPKMDKSFQGVKGNDLIEKVLLSPYDGGALRLALSKTSPGFLKGTTAEELIQEISALRLESMTELISEIQDLLNESSTSSMRIQIPGGTLHRFHSQKRTQGRTTMHPLAFFTGVYAFFSHLSDRNIMEDHQVFSNDDYSFTAVNEYEYVINGMTMNVREEMTFSSDTRHIRYRHLQRETVERNDDPSAVERYVVERGLIDSKSNKVKPVNPRRLRSTSTHRVTTETIQELNVEKCPSEIGITLGETVASATIRGTASAMANGSPSFLEVVAKGKATGHVDDAATLTGFDWEVSSQSRHESLNQGDNYRLGQTSKWHFGNIHGELATSGQLGELVVSGVGDSEDARKVLSVQDFYVMAPFGGLLFLYNQAEQNWRKGNCIELVVTSGGDPNRLRPGETRKIVVDARHSFEPTPPAVPVAGLSTSGTLTPPKPVQTPSASFHLKTDSESNGGSVKFSSVSKRGIAREVSTSFETGSTPVKVEVNYVQNETKTVRRATLPGIKIEGGEEKENIIMFHNSTLLHYPTSSSLKEGFLVKAEKDQEEGGKTEHQLEDGYYSYTKGVEKADVTGMAGNIEMVKGQEEGSKENIEGVASLNHPSEFLFFQGNAYDSAQISWSVQYPAKANGDVAFGSFGIIKGEKGVEWKENKITDPNSPYKTEYIIKVKIDAAEKLNEGDKAMKELLGFNLEGITKAVDPTKPSQSPVTATGSQTISIRILSPYPAK